MNISEELFKLNPWWEGHFHSELLPRPLYSQKLISNLKTKDIILITGLRRVGKTSLIKLFINYLIQKNDPKYVLYVSLDSLPLEKYSISDILREYRKIHELSLASRVYLFFDEVAYRQNVHQELKNLYDHENVKIYASSSSTSIFRDTRAFLTGRTRVLEILPLDFNEFITFKKITINSSEKYLVESYFEQYMRTGGIPEYVLTNDVNYLDNLIESIIYKDIVAYYGVRDLTGIRELFRLLMERAGKQISINKISKIMGVSPDTVRRYIDYFAQTFLIYTIERCGKLNERIRAPKKIYAADIGLRNYITGFRDKGAVFENLVYLKIKQKNPCYIYKNGLELDFYFDNLLLEIKFEMELSGKQKSFFEQFPAKKKIIINGMEDFFKIDSLI